MRQHLCGRLHVDVGGHHKPASRQSLCGAPRVGPVAWILMNLPARSRAHDLVRLSTWLKNANYAPFFDEVVYHEAAHVAVFYLELGRRAVGRRAFVALLSDLHD